MTTKPKTTTEVTAEFFRGGLAVVTKDKHVDPRGQLVTVTTTSYVRAHRRLIDRALQKLGYVRCPD